MMLDRDIFEIKISTNRGCNLVRNKWFQALEFRFLFWRCHHALISVWIIVTIYAPFDVHCQRAAGASTTHNNCDLFRIGYKDRRLSGAHYVLRIATSYQLGKSRATASGRCGCFTYNSNTNKIIYLP